MTNPAVNMRPHTSSAQITTTMSWGRIRFRAETSSRPALSGIYPPPTTPTDCSFERRVVAVYTFHAKGRREILPPLSTFRRTPLLLSVRMGSPHVELAPAAAFLARRPGTRQRKPTLSIIISGRTFQPDLRLAASERTRFSGDEKNKLVPYRVCGSWRYSFHVEASPVEIWLLSQDSNLGCRAALPVCSSGIHRWQTT